MTERFTILYETEENPMEWDLIDNQKDCLIVTGNGKAICDLLNELDSENKELLKYKYLTKALEEVSGSHYIEELIADFSDGAYCDDKEQIELGKWVVENGLSWEDCDD